MKGEKEDLSFLDLITYYESGPVLKQRTPDVIRTPSHPHELVFNYADDTDEAGKRLTKRKKLEKIHKKAIGLTDIPGGSPPGAQGWRPRSHYEQQDFEASHISGFGGPSVIDVQEDKPPSNISRLEKRKPINIPLTTETDNFFSFLQTGRLRRRRIPKKGSGMNLEQRELTKLAKALRRSGYNSQADIVIKLAANPSKALLAATEKFWANHSVSDYLSDATEDPAKVFLEGAVGAGTTEGKMAAALWVGLTNKQLQDELPEHASWYRMDYSTTASVVDVINGETGATGHYNNILMAIKNKVINSNNFDAKTGKRIGPDATPESTGQSGQVTTAPAASTPAAPTSRYSTALNNSQWAWGKSQEARSLQEKIGFTGSALDGKFGKNSKAQWARAYPNTPLPATAAVALDYANKTDQGTEGNGEAPTAESIAAAEKAKEAPETEEAKPAEAETKPEAKPEATEGEETEHYESNKVLGKTNEDNDGSVGVYLDDGKYYPAFLFKHEGNSYWLPIKDRGERTNNTKENFLTRSEQREIRKKLKPTDKKGSKRREERRTRRKSRGAARKSRRDARRAGRGR